MSVECGYCERDLRGGRAEDCPRHHTTIRRGDDFNCGVLGEDSLATAGIHVGDHLNAIECHGATLAEAQQLRERVLALLVQRDADHAAELDLSGAIRVMDKMANSLSGGDA